MNELGFTALAMEASASASQAVNAYVQGGAGDAAELIARLGFWTWRTEEVLAMVEWMREHNRDAPPARRVRFVGIDPQRCADSVLVVGDFLRRVAPGRAAALRDTLEVLAAARPGSRPDPEQLLRGEADELVRHFEDHEAEFVELTSPGRAGEAIRHAGILAQAADLVTRSFDPADPDESAFVARDRYMADAVASLVDGTSDRIALWAHNGHSRRGITPRACPHSDCTCGAATVPRTTRSACCSARALSGPAAART